MPLARSKTLLTYCKGQLRGEVLMRNEKRNTKDSGQCNAISAPTGRPPLLTRTLRTIVAHHYLGFGWKDTAPWVRRLHAPIRLIPIGALPLTATQSFRDYPYGLGSMRELETFFPSLCFNLYGLKQSLNGMPRPGGLGNGFMSPGANGSPSAPVIRADGCGRLLPRNVDPITVSTRYSARPRPGVWVGRPR